MAIQMGIHMGFGPDVLAGELKLPLPCLVGLPCILDDALSAGACRTRDAFWFHHAPAIVACYWMRMQAMLCPACEARRCRCQEQLHQLRQAGAVPSLAVPPASPPHHPVSRSQLLPGRLKIDLCCSAFEVARSHPWRLLLYPRQQS